MTAIARRTWYHHVRSCIGIRKPKTPQERAIYTATEKALADLRAEIDGELKAQVVKMVLIKRTHNYYGASRKVYVSYKTAQNICIAFIESVARYAKFLV